MLLADELGRVSDVRAHDFDGDQDIDVLVGVFGWQHTGRLLWLENQTEGPMKNGKPVFIKHEIHKRTGLIHAPLADFNGDGKMDFLAQFSQEHEKVVLF